MKIRRKIQGSFLVIFMAMFFNTQAQNLETMPQNAEETVSNSCQKTCVTQKSCCSPCACDCNFSGAGGFMMGFRPMNTQAFNQFRAEGIEESFSNNLMQIGGEGYGEFKRFLIGGAGYFTKGSSIETATDQFAIMGGGGQFNLGYAVVKQKQLLVFPQVGFGVDALGIEREALNNDNDEAEYSIASPTLDLGVGVDWFPGNKGFKVGLRAGYQLALNANPEWELEGTAFAADPLPQNQQLGGFYLRLTVGGGKIK